MGTGSGAASGAASGSGDASGSGARAAGADTFFGIGDILKNEF